MKQQTMLEKLSLGEVVYQMYKPSDDPKVNHDAIHSYEYLINSFKRRPGWIGADRASVADLVAWINENPGEALKREHFVNIFPFIKAAAKARKEFEDCIKYLNNL